VRTEDSITRTTRRIENWRLGKAVDDALEGLEKGPSASDFSPDTVRVAVSEGRECGAVRAGGEAKFRRWFLWSGVRAGGRAFGGAGHVARA
jgi:hypothetical protein